MRILVLDDNVKYGGLLCDQLKNIGITADFAASIGEFEEVAVSGLHDIFSIDLGLPDGDGIDLVKKLRANGCDIPIVIVTGRASVPERALGLDSGADDYVVKPFSFHEFAARVRALHRRRPLRQMRGIKAGKLVLDVETDTIAFEGSPINLSPAGRRVLAILIRRLGRVVPREAIAGTLQGPDCAATANAVEQNISRLRKFIDDPSMGVQLRTIRGTGYVLEEAVA